MKRKFAIAGLLVLALAFFWAGARLAFWAFGETQGLLFLGLVFVCVLFMAIAVIAMWAFNFGKGPPTFGGW